MGQEKSEHGVKRQLSALGILFFAMIGSLGILYWTIFIAPNTSVVDASDGCKSSFAEPISVQNGCGFVVDETAQTMRLNVHAELDQGLLEISVMDPAGREVWLATASGSTTHTTTVQAPMPGQWRINITAREAQGSYRIDKVFGN